MEIDKIDPNAAWPFGKLATEACIEAAPTQGDPLVRWRQANGHWHVVDEKTEEVCASATRTADGLWLMQGAVLWGETGVFWSESAARAAIELALGYEFVNPVTKPD